MAPICCGCATVRDRGSPWLTRPSQTVLQKKLLMQIDPVHRRLNDKRFVQQGKPLHDAKIVFVP